MVSYANRTLTWKHGRQLATLKDGTNAAWAYLYDDSGMRVKRTNGTIAYTYVYDGGKLTYMTRGSQELSFTYDGDGNPMSVTFTNSEGTNTYYYVTNLQGDVTALLTPDGTCVVEYTYDAWGNILSRTGSLEGTLGVSNPLRYRGYVYDIETGLYYLQSRYYDPQLGRFISADALVSTGQGLLGNNMFSYCANNPVNRADPDGLFWRKVSNWAKNTWNGLTNFVSDLFGAGCTTTSTLDSYESEVTPPLCPISITNGYESTQTVTSKGDSSKPISVYADGSLDDPILSSSAGINLNASNVTLNISVGLDNGGISTSFTNNNITKTFTLKSDVAHLKWGFESATSVASGNTTTTTYSNISINGWAVLYYVLTTLYNEYYGTAPNSSPSTNPNYYYP